MGGDGVLTQRRRDAEVERGIFLVSGLSRKERKERKDSRRVLATKCTKNTKKDLGDGAPPHTPYPECALIVGDLQVAFNAESQRRGEAEFLNRVEHVDHVEDLEMGFHPIPRIRANRN